MAMQLLKEARSKGIYIYLENEKLKVKAEPGALTDELRNRIKQQKPALVTLLSELAQVKKRDEKDQIKTLGQTKSVLSYPQQRLWLAEQLAPNSTQFVIPGALKFIGTLNVSALEQSFEAIIARHEILRTTYIKGKNGPLQVINEASQMSITKIDFSDLSLDEQLPALKRLQQCEESKPFDLSQDLMLRSALVKLSLNEQILLLSFHHIATDAWSIGLFINELMSLYSAFSEGEIAQLAPLKIQYADYAKWQKDRLEGDILQTQIDYWHKQLSGIPILHSLPLDKPRPQLQTTQGSSYLQKLNSDLTKKIMDLSQSQGATLFILLETVFALLISRISHEQDIVIGTPVAARENQDVQGLIGFFVNNLVLRSQVDPDQSFVSLLASNKSTILSAYENQEIPFERLVDELNTERSLHHSPLFQIVFGLNNTPATDLSLSGLSCSILENDGAAAKVDLELIVIHKDDELVVRWVYNKDLFDESSIAGFALSYESLLNCIVEAPQQQVASYPILTEKQKNTVLEYGTGINSELLKLCLHQNLNEEFTKQALMNPQSPAVSYGDLKLDYKTLNERANRLAAYLQEVGVEVGSRVGICLDRSISLVIAVLGVMKAGATYVALEPELPDERLEYMVDDANIELVLFDEDSMGRVLLGGVDIFMMDGAQDDDSWLEDFSNIDVNVCVTPEDPLYILYTSGSTGKPKGVLVPHSGVINYLNHAVNAYMDVGIKGAIVSSPLCFDATITTLLTPLFVGKIVHLIPDCDESLALLAEQLFEQSEPWLFKITPAHLEAISHLIAKDEACCSAHKIVVGGEQLTYETLAPYRDVLLPNSTFINEYGPTETVVGCSTYVIAPQKEDIEQKINLNVMAVPIGKPVCNARLYVLSSGMQLQPVNSIGELYIAGSGVTLGYLNLAKQTQENFITHPDFPNERLYRTGDLVRWLETGELVFVGRRDNQVKIRGFRIELEEIENQLQKQEDIKNAVVQACSDGSKDKSLIAYVVTNQELAEQHFDSQKSNNNEVLLQEKKVALEREFLNGLHSVLPQYMVPSRCVIVDAIPLTTNGKVDTKALTLLDENDGQSFEYTAPRNETERLLCDIWQTVLKLDVIGVQDNFFSIGGDSILSIRIISQLMDSGIKLSIQDLFRFQTIALLAQHIHDSETTTHQIKQVEPFSLLTQEERAFFNNDNDNDNDYEDVYPLSALQAGMVFHSQLDGYKGTYHDINGVHVKYPWDQAHFSTALELCINRHPLLRTGYQLAGDRPLQHIHRKIPLPLVVEDISKMQPDAQDEKLTQWIAQRQKHVFDWNAGPLFQVNIFLRSSESFEFIVSFHHSILDGWSRTSLTTELFQYFSLLLSSEPVYFKETDWTYRDYIASEQEVLKGREAKAYFIDILADTSSEQLPRKSWINPDEHDDKESRNGHKMFHAEGLVAVSRKVIALTQELGVPVQAVLLAAHYKVLSTVSGLQRVMTCMVTNGRPEKSMGDQGVGLFLNSLPLSFELKQQSWRSLILQVAEQITQSMAYRHYPLLQIQKDVNKTFSEVLFNYTHFHELNSLLEDESMNLQPLSTSGVESTNFDFSVDFYRGVTGKEIGLSFSYNSEIYDENQIIRIGQYYENALNAMVNAIDECSLDYSLLLEPELKFLQQWNDTQKKYQVDKCIHELFEMQVENNPNAVALVFKGSQLTYGDLNNKANQLAYYLSQEMHVKPETLVGICIDRSFEMVVGILAILKAGGAYVPLDSTYPKARLQYMLDDSGLKHILTQKHLVNKLKLFPARELIVLDDQKYQEELNCYSTANIELDEKQDASTLAYVIYTSGSTGQPKGVMVEHAQWNAYQASITQLYEVTSSDNVLQFSSISFDIFVEELSISLLNGGCLTLLDSKHIPTSGYLSAFLNEHKISIVSFPTAYWHQLCGDSNFVKADINSLRLIITGGEALAATSAQYLQHSSNQNVTLLNTYGPTETTVVATSYKVCTENVGSDSIPIGQPLANDKVYVLDNAQALVPQGTTGELYIGGASIARGYLNQVELTKEKFIVNPFSEASERLYRTGDLVRWLYDGNLEFLGRIDDQIKIRGFRVELGEIESILLSHDAVMAGVVSVKETLEGDKRIVAYVVTNSFEALDVTRESKDNSSNLHQELIASLRNMFIQTLPEYMTPSAFVFLDKLPLTVNGKVDYKALPEPDLVLSQADYVAPSTATEQVLCDIWQDVLKVPLVSITDNFFELGGHSLLVMQVIAKSQQAGLIINAKDLFTTPTLCDLAISIDQSNNYKKKQDNVFQAPANLIPENCEKITPKMLPLVCLTEEDLTLIAAKIPDGMKNIQDIYPLAPLQEGILFHHIMSENSDPYVFPALLKIDNREALDNFLTGLQLVIDRHDVFRTAVLWHDLPQPVQVVLRDAQLPVSWFELTPEQDPVEVLTASEQQWIALDKAPIMHVAVASKPGSEQLYMMLKYHHIIADHTGVEGIQKELLAYQSGNFHKLLAPKMYRDLVAHSLHQAKHHDASDFFTGLLGDVDEPTLPFNLRDVHSDGVDIIELEEEIPLVVSNQLRGIAKNLKVSPAVIFHAAYALVISACSGRDDVIFGTVLSGRLQGVDGSENTMGMFINTLPLRVKLKAISTVDFVHQVQQGLLDLIPYEQASLALAQNCSALTGATPLFSAMLNYRHSAPHDDANSNEVVTGVRFMNTRERTNYPFNLSIDDYGNDFSLHLQIDASISEKRIMDYMQTAIAALVESLEFKPEQSLKTLSILPKTEFVQLLKEYNDTAVNFPSDKCIHELFETQVQSEPNAIAVVINQQKLTYGELNSKANQLAHYLVEQKNVRPDTLVGICAERSLEMVVGILAIVKAGGVYVPLDPDYPQTRLCYMLEDAQLKTVLMQSHLKSRVPILESKAVYLDDDEFSSELNHYPTQNLRVSQLGLHTHHLAYVIYTSGSTGRPKGVMISHYALQNRIDWMTREYGASCNDSILQKTPFSFDVSVWEFFWTLTTGARMVLAKAGGHKDPEYLSKLIQSEKINKLHFVPSMLSSILMHKALVQCTSLKQVFCSGEALSIQQVKAFQSALPNTQLHNLYGPTEAAIDVSYWDCLQPSGASVPIGKPIQNIQLLILDKQFKLTVQGVVGELFIAGAGLARGYLNQDELTAQKFIDNPFYDENDVNSSKRLYQTGDLVRRLKDGNLEFLGRIDHQVKIRGFRIELGEIEHAITSHDEVNDAVVLVNDLGNGDKKLVAYITVTNVNKIKLITSINEVNIFLDQELLNSLRKKLSDDLPDYMVPSSFIILDRLPLTTNGKVNRKALPEPDLSMQQTSYVEPTTEIELMLCKIWQSTLDLEQIGITDNFFEIGGHSLLATQLIAKIRSDFDIELKLGIIFTHQTIKELAKVVKVSKINKLPKLSKANYREQWPLSYAQKRFWLIEQITGPSSTYNMPAAIKLEGGVNSGALEKTYHALLERHEVFRTAFNLEHNGEAVQRIVPMTEIDVSIEVITVSELSIQEAVRDHADIVFDLSKPPLFKLQLLDLADGQHILLANLHHIISDGWSIGILVKEFNQLYASFSNNIDSILPVLPYQYTDYSVWQQTCFNQDKTESVSELLSYWEQHLQQAPRKLSLPVDHINDSNNIESQSRNYSALLPTSELNGLQQLALTENSTLFSILLTGLNILLAKWTGEEDIVVGTVVAGRDLEGLESIIGCFINMLVLRTSVSDEQNLKDLIKSTHETVINGLDKQAMPFDLLVEHLNPQRTGSQSPLNNVSLRLHNMEAVELEMQGVRFDSLSKDIGSGGAQLDIMFEAKETIDGLELAIEYESKLFTEQTISLLLRNYMDILNVLNRKREVKLSEISLTDTLLEQIELSKQLSPKFVISSTFTAEPIESALRFWGKQFGQNLEVEFSPFNQVFQQLLNPASELLNIQVGCGVILLRWEDWLGESSKDLENNGNNFFSALESALTYTNNAILLLICPPSAMVSENLQQVELFEKLENKLAIFSQNHSKLQVIHSSNVLNTYPVLEHLDPFLEKEAHIPYTDEAFTAFSTAIYRTYNAWQHRPHKVIVLDCDNTLWEGVCGEVGVSGVKVSEPFKALQAFVLEQYKQGIVLCLNSKNNEEDVIEVFENHPDMLLTLDHIVISKINWQKKSENIKAISDELNLGLDSFIFIDDDAVQCAEVRSCLPQVHTLQLPNILEDIPQYLEHNWIFDSVTLQNASSGNKQGMGAKRSRYYKENLQRQQQNTHELLSDFITSLDLKIDIQPISGKHISRVSELSLRTNQFNLTTNRYNENELLARLADGNCLGWVINVSDRFGEYGDVGVMLVETLANELKVTDFMLSCRAMGRGVEHAMIRKIGDIADQMGLLSIELIYRKSKKNLPALHFLQSLNLNTQEDSTSCSRWHLMTQQARLIKLKVNGNKEAVPNVDVTHVEDSKTAVYTSNVRAVDYEQIAMSLARVVDIQNDIKSLSKPIHSLAVSSANYIAPQNQVEIALCEIWQDLLGIKQVGTQDNFFELGGHSLLATRLVTKINKAFDITMVLDKVFKTQTIALLAEAIEQQQLILTVQTDEDMDILSNEVEFTL